MRLRPFYSDKLVCALCGLGCRRCLFSSPSRYVGHGREKRRERERERGEEREKTFGMRTSPVVLFLYL